MGRTKFPTDKPRYSGKCYDYRHTNKSHRKKQTKYVTWAESNAESIPSSDAVPLFLAPSSKQPIPGDWTAFPGYVLCFRRGLAFWITTDAIHVILETQKLQAKYFTSSSSCAEEKEQGDKIHVLCSCNVQHAHSGLVRGAACL